MSTGPLRERFGRDGYVHLPGFLGPDEADRLRRAVETAPERVPGPNPLSLGSMRFASNLFYGSPELVGVLTSTRLLEVVVELLGPDAWVRWDQAVWKEAGAPPFPLHQDNGYTGLTASHLQVWFALTDMDAGNGGLVVVPGGHRADLPHRWEGNHVVTDTDLPRAAIDAVAGDVIAFSSRLPHETTANETDRPRLAYVAEYLPLAIDDPSVPRPHLVACRGGRPVGRLELADDTPPTGPGGRGRWWRALRGRSGPTVGSNDA